MHFLQKLFSNDSKRDDEAILFELVDLRSNEVFEKIEKIYLALDNKNINNIYYNVSSSNKSNFLL